MDLTSDFQIVILECPYDAWHEDSTRELFGKMVALKLSGYLSAYPYGVLPFDASDFVGCHYMLCRSQAGGLTPIQACKLVTLRRCRIHGMTFPPLAMATGSAQHFEVISSIVERAEREGRAISYDSSWTMDPKLRREPGYPRLLREILAATIVQVHREYGIQESICFGVPRFNTEKYFHSLGYRPIKQNGTQLPVVALAQFMGERVIYLHKRTFTADATGAADRYLPLWDRRLVVRGKTV